MQLLHLVHPAIAHHIQAAAGAQVASVRVVHRNIGLPDAPLCPQAAIQYQAGTVGGEAEAADIGDGIVMPVVHQCRVTALHVFQDQIVVLIDKGEVVAVCRERNPVVLTVDPIAAKPGYPRAAFRGAGLSAHRVVIQPVSLLIPAQLQATIDARLHIVFSRGAV